MCVLVEGTWVGDHYAPYDADQFMQGISNIHKFIITIIKIKQANNNDWETALDSMDIGNTLGDMSMWTVHWDHLVMATDTTFRKSHYDAYLVLLSICKHCWSAGDLIWNTRTVILDRGLTKDYVVSEMLK